MKLLTQISHPQGLDENRKVAQRGGNVAKVARESLEQETGKPVITRQTAIDFAELIGNIAKISKK